MIMINKQKSQDNPIIRQIKVEIMWQSFGEKTDDIISELSTNFCSLN